MVKKKIRPRVPVAQPQIRHKSIKDYDRTSKCKICKQEVPVAVAICDECFDRRDIGKKRK